MRTYLKPDGSLHWPDGEPSDPLTPAQVAEAQTLARIYEQKSEPATLEEMLMPLQQLDIIMGSKPLDDSAQRLRWRAYFEDLADVPLDSLVEACRMWRTNPDNRFFPTPGQLLDLCQTKAVRLGMAARFKAIADWKPKPIERLTEAQRAQVVRRVGRAM